MNRSEEIKEFIRSLVTPRLIKLGLGHSFLLRDPDLLKAGIFDSLSFIEFIGKIESHFKIEIDFEKHAPSELSVISKLEKVLINLLPHEA